MAPSPAKYKGPLAGRSRWASAALPEEEEEQGQQRSPGLAKGGEGGQPVPA